MKQSVFILLALTGFLHTTAQTADTIAKKTHSPRTAMILSSVIPGAGQVYNRQYWKIPIIIGGFAGLIYGIDFNNNNYRDFRNSYLLRYDNDTNTIDNYYGVYSDESIIALKDYYKRNRDFYIIGTGLLYILNVLDAYVFAHLKDFDINQELSIRVHPGFYTGTYARPYPVPGVALTCYLK
ncbi:MAG: hypothetical protein HYY40_01695 [Bacteroidetes bacterium]|nr:hypothetical protein [Bacteroidota bacterium]